MVLTEFTMMANSLLRNSTVVCLNLDRFDSAAQGGIAETLALGPGAAFYEALFQGTTSGVTVAGKAVANFAIEFFLIAVQS
jgi:hypothetical protein